MSARNILIVNPKAGKHDSTEFISASAAKLLSGIPYEIRITEYPGHAAEIARSLCGDECRIYACGGDGTLNEVVNGVFRGGCPGHVSVGCVPIGSGNDFIKSFENISPETFLDLSRQAAGDIRKIDLLQVEDRVSINILSAGYDAAVCDNLERFKRLPLVNGSAAYNMSVVYCLARYMKNRYTLYADGEEVADEKRDYL
ncbi:MAG: acylglycerol kinase family protein, partial [Eubacteriales bacterium]|nr:acylglycerol kinase family protein [Eubacteriales bacterium]